MSKNKKLFIIPTHLISNNSYQYVVYDKKGDKHFALGINNPNFHKFQYQFTKKELKRMPSWCHKLKVKVEAE